MGWNSDGSPPVYRMASNAENRNGFEPKREGVPMLLILHGLDGETFAIRPGIITQIHASPAGATIVTADGAGREVTDNPDAILEAVASAGAKREVDPIEGVSLALAVLDLPIQSSVSSLRRLATRVVEAELLKHLPRGNDGDAERD